MFLLEPRKNNLSNPDENSEPCQTSQIELFLKIVNRLLPFSEKHFILDV